MWDIYNFSAGPAVLPEPVLQEAADEMMDYKGSGMSVMEQEGLGHFPTSKIPVRRVSVERGFTEKGTLFLCLLLLSIILDNNSYPDFFGIMTFYQECCICAISSKKGRDNMGDFSSIYKFF